MLHAGSDRIQVYGKLGFYTSFDLEVSRTKKTFLDRNSVYVIWVKVIPDSQTTEIICESDENINRLKIKIKGLLSTKFDQVSRDEIIVRDANGAIIRPSYLVTSRYYDETPFFVDAPAPTPSTGKISPLPPSLSVIS